MSVSYSSVWHGFPVPNVGIRNSSAHPCPFNGVHRSADGVVTPVWTNYPVIAATNVPINLLEPAFDLRLELVLWRAKQMKKVAGTNRYIPSGWKHPTDFDAMASGIHQGGDSHNGSQDNVVDSRKSEWIITSKNQIEVVNLSGYFRAKDIKYRDNAGVEQIQQVLCPVTTTQRAAPGKMGGLKGINARLTPLYFAFRYSMKDVEYGVGRVIGPISPVMVASHKYSPFVIDPTFKYANGNKVGYLLNGSYDITQMQCRFARRNAIE